MDPVNEPIHSGAELETIQRVRELKDHEDDFCFNVASGMSYVGAYYEARGGKIARNSCSTAAHRLLENDSIQARIEFYRQSIRAGKMAAAGATIADVTAEIAKVAFSNIGEISEVRGKSAYLDLSKAEPHHFAAIQSIETDVVMKDDNDAEDGGEIILKTKVKLHDKMKALAKLADILDDRPRGRDGRIIEGEFEERIVDENPALKAREEATRVAYFLRAQADVAPQIIEHDPNVVVSRETMAQDAPPPAPWRDDPVDPFFEGEDD